MINFLLINVSDVLSLADHKSNIESWSLISKMLTEEKVYACNNGAGFIERFIFSCRRRFP
ncbi:hypothetical protein RSA36_15495 [Pantoea stewartii]|uniref:Uncharacterized protein n=1 Tax=Pantoea stewartii TaxID=66269 RepID=A0AB34VFB5_9GAMM|nr:hypothetical protein RSA30_15730 [Pantoea stewartii]KTS97609.1 hypothetical protein RSA13_10935 [Pantoea stewartii]KTT06627.1 hypothetical protein RSA36_15495 [Pantoea stewartii]